MAMKTILAFGSLPVRAARVEEQGRVTQVHDLQRGKKMVLRYGPTTYIIVFADKVTAQNQVCIPHGS